MFLTDEYIQKRSVSSKLFIPKMYSILTLLFFHKKRDSERFQKNPNDSKRFQKRFRKDFEIFHNILKDSERFREIMEVSRRFRNIRKDSGRFKIPKIRKRFLKIPKVSTQIHPRYYNIFTAHKKTARRLQVTKVHPSAIITLQRTPYLVMIR